MRASSSERGFVSAVITVIFVAAALVLCIRFLMTQSEQSGVETLARQKLKTEFARQGSVADVKAAFDVVVDSACVEDLTITPNNAAFNLISSSSGSHCLSPDSAYNSLITPSGNTRVGRVIVLTNANPAIAITEYLDSSSAGQGSGAPSDPAGDTTGSTGCFSGNTPVLIGMSHGVPQYKRIDSLKEGDTVLSIDQHSYEASMLGRISVADSTRFAALHSIQSRLKPVKIDKLLRHTQPNEGAVKLTLSSGVLVTTQSHPFMALQRGWTSLVYLGNNGQLVSLDGNLQRILQVEELKVPMDIFNLSLHEAYTYFVLPEGALSPIWVHNATTGGMEKNMGGL